MSFLVTVRVYSGSRRELVGGDAVEGGSWRIRLDITSHHQYYLILEARCLPYCEKSATALDKYLLPALVLRKPKFRVQKLGGPAFFTEEEVCGVRFLHLCTYYPGVSSWIVKAKGLIADSGFSGFLRYFTNWRVP